MKQANNILEGSSPSPFIHSRKIIKTVQKDQVTVAVHRTSRAHRKRLNLNSVQ